MTTEYEEFTQSQAHGLIWDNEIREKVYGLPKCINDTKKHDIDCSENRFCEKENVSIKACGGKSIDCGDILRFFDIDFTGETHINITILRYSQTDEHKNLQKIIEFKYDTEVHKWLFGTVTSKELEEYVGFVKSIPRGNADASVKQEYKERKKTIQDLHKMNIRISPKVDSGTQRRVQCAIPDMDELFTHFPGNVISSNDTAILREVQITHMIPSARRKRNPKPVLSL